jgi:A/G-specific adenine glycosylase
VAAFLGLGYNRRAVFLYRSAVAIVARHDGNFPDTLKDLLALPGVGPYTARAVLAFAYEQDVAVVDTNVSRVIARALVGAPVGAKEVQAYADQLVPLGGGWLWNQGLLDFAAIVCTKRAPACHHCPFVSDCVWQNQPDNTDDPANGSAFVTGTQSTFVGSDRQGRGRVITALAGGPLTVDMLPAITGWSDQPERIARMLAGLERDGLLTRHGDTLELSR